MPPCKALWRSTCWSVVVLSAVCAYGGPGGHGVQPHGMSAHGVRQRSVGPSAELQESTAQAVTAPQAVAPAVDSSTPVALADPTLASTAAKRAQLRYLVRSALPAQSTVYADAEGERFTFQGSMGLAPRWLTAAMTPSEERWVSACLLAHVNYFGKKVQVSMRATPPPVPAVEAS